MQPIEKTIDKIEQEYLGFKPNSGSVKPVHIANGFFRTVTGKTYSTNQVHKFVFSETKKGKVPRGHDLDSVYSFLVENKIIDERDVSREDLPALRRLLKSVVNADSGVFTGTMQSYTHGFSYLVSKDTIAQDGGELIAKCLKVQESDLIDYVKNILSQENDIISTLCKPLLRTGSEVNGTIPEPEHLPTFFNSSDNIWSGILESANTLTSHLLRSSNKLLDLRRSVLFVCFVIIRHLTCAESYYVAEAKNRIPPFLLDFSDSASSSVARSSLQTYMRATQSVSRFYGWAISEELKRLWTIDELYEQEPPLYKGRSGQNLTSKRAEREFNEAQEIWGIARQRAQDEPDPYRVFGEAIYEMFSTQASANANEYMRKLGLRVGLFYPPNRSTHRFRITQDILEVLVRGAVEPNESIDMNELQDRFWQRYRIIIGGRLDDEEELQKIGVYQVDRNGMCQEL